MNCPYNISRKKTLFNKGENDSQRSNNNSPDREPTIKELEEQLRRKKLKEELAKKATKQSRDFDESMLGVCHTCHVPVYYGEPLHKLQTLDSEGSHSGWYGGARDGAGMFETGTSTHGGVYGGKNKSHSVIEGCEYSAGSVMKLGKRRWKPLKSEKADGKCEGL